MLVGFLLISAAAAAVLPSRQDSACTNPTVRKEWRALSADERTSYIDAVNCLAKTPSKLGLNTTRYDDFPYVHSLLNNDIHSVASFLPWHRYFVHIYEKALQECGYTGSATYWDWTLDANDPASSPIWDPTTGLGGNGHLDHAESSGGNSFRCVTDGPFQNLRLAYYGDKAVPHCLSRNFNNSTQNVGQMLGQYYTPEVVAGIHDLPDFEQFHLQLESTPHGAVHSAIGGDMSPATSPNDAVFFLHHGQVDRLWYLWQQENPDNRTYDYSGYRTQNQYDGVIPPAAALDDIMPMLGLADDIPVRDIMSAESSILCYKY